ncbi:MAG: hypothetical protein KC456_09185, partial [Flavobacteriales bacterium]|nr:hypothetical protein [Flavobacteriales bacterium]
MTLPQGTNRKRTSGSRFSLIFPLFLLFSSCSTNDVGFDEQDLNHHSDALYKELIGGLNDHPNSVLKVLNEPDLNIDASHKRYLRSRALSHTNRDQEALLEL